MKILIIVPTFETVKTATFKSIYDLQKPTDAVVDLEFVKGYVVHTARNIGVQIAIERGYDYVLWVDSDVILPKDLLVRLLACKADIATGYYIKKVEGQRITELCGTDPNRPNEPNAISNILEDGLPKVAGIYPIKACGFGCTLTRTQIFRTMLEQDKTRLCFAYIQTRDKFISEDFEFCERARNIGYTIVADTGLRCGHIGEKIF